MVQLQQFCVGQSNLGGVSDSDRLRAPSRGVSGMKSPRSAQHWPWLPGFADLRRGIIECEKEKQDGAERFVPLGQWYKLKRCHGAAVANSAINGATNQLVS